MIDSPPRGRGRVPRAGAKGALSSKGPRSKSSGNHLAPSAVGAGDRLQPPAPAGRGVAAALRPGRRLVVREGRRCGGTQSSRVQCGGSHQSARPRSPRSVCGGRKHVLNLSHGSTAKRVGGLFAGLPYGCRRCPGTRGSGGCSPGCPARESTRWWWSEGKKAGRACRPNARESAGGSPSSLIAGRAPPVLCHLEVQAGGGERALGGEAQVGHVLQRGEDGVGVREPLLDRPKGAGLVNHWSA